MAKKTPVVLLNFLIFFVFLLGCFQFNCLNIFRTANAESSEMIEELVKDEIEAVVITQPEIIQVENEMTSSTQQIAVVWKDDISLLENVRLVYLDQNENEIEIQETRRTESAILFEEETENLSEGSNQLLGLRYYITGFSDEKTFVFDDAQIDADFSVVKMDENTANEMEESYTQIEITDVDRCETIVTNGVEQALTEIDAPVDSLATNDDPFVIVLNPGHGGTDSGAVGYGLLEKNLNLSIALYCKQELEQYKNVKVYMTRDYDKTGSLGEYCDYANEVHADLLVSIHNNASGSGNAHGAEVWYPNQNYRYDLCVEGQGVSQSILNELIALGLSDRGIKTSYDYNATYPDGSIDDWYYIPHGAKLYGICGIIIEHAFIDNYDDVINFLNSDEKLKKLGIADATGIAKYYGFKKNGTYEKKDINLDGNITLDDAILAKAVAMKSYAKELTAEQKQAGDLNDDGIITINEARSIKKTAYNASTNDDDPTISGYYAISGTSKITKDQLVNYFTNIMGQTYPSFYANSDAPTLSAFCQIYVEEAKTENIRVEVAFCQAMKETGWLKYGGRVAKEQYNFAGLGATDGGGSGASFSSVREGIRAQIQHLKAYANTDTLKNPIVDPRFNLVTRGSAPYVEWLGQQENPSGKGWATDKNYGYDIVNMIKKIK